MRYSKATRELAAVRCQVIADYWTRGYPRPDAYQDFTDDPRAVLLSTASYTAAIARPHWQGATVMEDIATGWAEAEALIRTGWEPG